MNTCPNGFICINNSHMIYISVISLMLIYIVNDQYYKDIFIKLKKANINTNINETINSNTDPNTNVDLNLDIYNSYNNNSNKDYIDRDRAVINDPLYPPLKRNYNFPEVKKMPINIETRESGGDYQQIGVLHKTENTNKNFDKPGNNDESVILGLYGKPLYRRSSNWLYYVISEKNNIKIPLVMNNVNCSNDTQGCKEIMNGEVIDIAQYNGSFKVEMYKFDSPKYIPYI